MQKVPISEDVLKNMCIKGRFAMGPIYITVPSQLVRVVIYLCLQEGLYPYSVDSYLPLNEFPGALMIQHLTQSE
jgi:hypothetical protein